MPGTHAADTARVAVEQRPRLCEPRVIEKVAFAAKVFAQDDAARQRCTHLRWRLLQFAYEAAHGLYGSAVHLMRLFDVGLAVILRVVVADAADKEFIAARC